MRSSKWLVFIRPALAGFDRPLTLGQIADNIALRNANTQIIVTYAIVLRSGPSLP
jgi:hypothetical protein